MVKKAAKIFLINKRNEILIFLRDDKPSIDYPNYWDLIGGLIEPEETPGQTLTREIIEEINISVSNITLLGNILIKKNPLNSEDTQIFVFKGNIDREISEIQLNEGQKLEFVKLEELENFRIVPEYKEFFSKLI